MDPTLTASPSASTASSLVSIRQLFLFLSLCSVTLNFFLFKFTVDDEIVIELVEKEIQTYEKKAQSWIIQGFPRTRVQALSLQRMGIIPDKLINLNIRKHNSLARIKQNLVATSQDVYGDMADEIAERMFQEYEINMNSVCETFNQFIYQMDCQDKAQNEVANDLARMLRIRHRNNAPRRPPKVMLIGPPGSGRSSQAQQIADAFGLVNISPQKILKAEAERNPPIKIKLQEAQENGEPIPDEIILRLVDERIRQSDCRVNGWILDGFPETESQVNLLKSMRINPNLVCMFEQSIDESINKLQARRIDPMTGELFNTEVNPPKFESQNLRLQRLPQDAEDLVRKRFSAWESNITMLEENYKNCLLSVAAERLTDQVFDTIREAIENPIF